MCKVVERHGNLQERPTRGNGNVGTDSLRATNIKGLTLQNLYAMQTQVYTLFLKIIWVHLTYCERRGDKGVKNARTVKATIIQH